MPSFVAREGAGFEVVCLWCAAHVSPASNGGAPCFVGLSLSPVVVNVSAREASVESAVAGSAARDASTRPATAAAPKGQLRDDLESHTAPLQAKRGPQRPAAQPFLC